MAGRTNDADRPSFASKEEAPVTVVVRTCPLCTEEIQVLCGEGPQVVVCESCGLACSVDPIGMASPVDQADEPQPTEATAEDVYSWLERPPGPILPSADFTARQQAARRRQLAMAGFVAASAALAIAILSGYFGYHQASDQLALRHEATQSEQAAAQQQLLAVQQRLESERQAAELQRVSAERSVRIVTAKYLAAQSQELAAAEPWQSVAISADAVRTTLDADGIFIPEAHQSLRDALLRCAASHNIDAVELRGHAGVVTTMAISPDGRWLATGSADRTARLWDLKANQPQTTAVTLNVHQKHVTSVLFSSDNRWLYTGSRDSSACAWSLGAEAPASIPIVLPSKGQPISQMALTPDGKWLAAVSTGGGDAQGAGQLWNLTAGPANAVSMELTGHVGAIKSIATSPSSRWLALGVGDAVKLWDLTARDPAAASLERQCRLGQLTSAQFTGDGRKLVTCGDATTGAARLWDLSSADPTDSVLLQELSGPIRSATVSADSRWLVVLGDDRQVRLYDLNASSPETAATTLTAGAAPLVAVAMSAKGQWLAASDATGQVFLWSVSPQGIERQAVVLTNGEKSIRTLAFTPDGQWLATAGDDWTVRLWNLNIGELAAEAQTLAQQQMRSPAPKKWSEQLQATLQAFDAAQLAQITEAGILWNSVRTKMSTVGPDWRTELLDRLQRAAEARVAEKPRDKELGSVDRTVIEIPSLTVAMPETEAPKRAAAPPALQHDWPVRSIVKRPANEGKAAEPRTATLPQSTIQIHTR